MDSSAPESRSSISLTSFTENDVIVSIQLNSIQDGTSVLTATFTPPDGYHLYSKDIPINGSNGLGRPTLLELPPDSQLIATDKLMESVPAQVPNFEPRELLVYPAGPITLSLQVELPAGDPWRDDTVIITYMACSDNLCKPPVVGKVVPIRIPGIDTLDIP
jgi:hypothetical protein